MQYAYKLLNKGVIMRNIIETENISKQYGKLKAVDRVSLSVKKGEIYGFLGLNGAGKTTTIRMLLGMISPSSGVAYINGIKINPAQKNIWKDVGYLVEIPYAYPELTVKENLNIFSKLREISGDSVNRVIESLKLTQYKDVKARHLSQGNAQRLGIAKAMIHNPDILILDEPANGLDPAGIVEIRELLKDLSLNQNKTIFISSHILTEIARMADRIGIIHKGKLIKELDETDLEKERLKSLVINTGDNQLALNKLIKAGYNVKINQINLLEIADKEAIENPDRIVVFLVEEKIPPIMVKVENEDLESYFLRIIGEGVR